jgi:FkbM family methyltransferase
MLPNWLKPYFTSIRLWYVSTWSRPVKELYEEKPFVAGLFSQMITKQDVVLEVGARIGSATRKLSELALFVHSVEADKNNYKMLTAYMKRYRNVRTYHFAAWNENREGELKIAMNDCFSAVTSVKGIQGHEYPKTQKVQFRTLDSVPFDPVPNVLAFDCEGAETEALIGSHRILLGVNKAIIETHKTSTGYDSKSDVMRILGESGLSLSEDDRWAIGLRQARSL